MLAVSGGTQLGGQPLVTLDFPAPLQQRVVNALKADPKTVDLRAQAPQYYSLGAKILDLFEDEDLADVLIEVCTTLPVRASCLSFITDVQEARRRDR